MDSFFSLFDPSEGQSKPKKRHKAETENAKTEQPKGRRRGRRANGKNETLPEESSFLCEPDLSSEVLVKSGSYFDSFFEVNDNVADPKDDKKPKRRNSGRKSRRKKSKITPTRESSPWLDTEVSVINNNALKNNTSLNNITDFFAKKLPEVGRNVNDLRIEDKDGSKRKDGNISAEEKQVNNVIEQLEKVSVKYDAYTTGDFSADDLDESSDTDSAGLNDSSSDLEGGCQTSLPPEPRFGNVEYKLHLVNPQERRLQHLVTQLKWRLRSGGGLAIYVIGVRDCGTLRGLPPKALRASLRTLRRMAATLRAAITHVTARRVTPHRAVAEIYIRKLPEAQQCELRIAVVGAHGAGKSTLIGVLTQGELDNGRGSARLNMFRHVHEVRSGNTSSLSHEILGFDEKGNVVNYGCSELMTAERIGERSSKLVSFLDLAGHSKYQRTTVTGMTGYRPHYAMLLVSATAGVTSITEEHMELIEALEVPHFTVLTKCDLRPRGGDTAVGGSKPVIIKDEEAARNCAAPKKLILDALNNNDSGNEEDKEDEAPINPVFHVSCVTGQGLRALHAYLLALQPPPARRPPHDHESCEFQIDEIFHVGENAGPVVGGLMARGQLYERDNLLIGPLDSGEFIEISVNTIYRNRVPCDTVKAGQSASLGLSFYPPNLRQGMVLLAIPENYRKNEGPVFSSGTVGPCRCIRNINLAKRKWKDKNTDKTEDVNLYVDSGNEKERCKCYDNLPLDDPDNPRGCFYFQANIHLLKHPTDSISPGFQCTVYIGNVRQTAIIEGLFTSTNTLKVGESCHCVFRLARRAEFLRAGRRILCRAGGTRAAGRVTQVFPATDTVPRGGH